MIKTNYYQKAKQIKKQYGLNYIPELFEDKKHLENKLEKLANKKIPIFFISNFFIVVNQSDAEILIRNGKINLNVIQ